MLHHHHKRDVARARAAARSGQSLSLVPGFVVVHVAGKTLFHYPEDPNDAGCATSVGDVARQSVPKTSP